VAELPSVVRSAHAWGVDGVWVQNLSHSFSDTDPAGGYAGIRRFAEREALWGEPNPEATAIFDRSRALADELGVELRLPRLEAPPPTPRAPGTPACGWPWDSAYVTHDAKVQPCCMVMGADRAVLGDAERDGFAAVWHNDAYAEFRGRLLDEGEPPEVCRGCSLYRRLF
jgi:radical SAM protein with 4Fe4S-binding SPASM domain